jgi:hypothetical protein|mmetsp:Transcript_49802/g.83477  ORF Transcript_49802/g.83477 Transcript_49802/m.83477 type:complete len:89 (-) Transcript_49802:2870-3136(-)
MQDTYRGIGIFPATSKLQCSVCAIPKAGMLKNASKAFHSIKSQKTASQWAISANPLAEQAERTAQAKCVETQVHHWPHSHSFQVAAMT